MKKYLMVIALFVIALTVVQAQFVAYYSEEYNERTGVLKTKSYYNTNGDRRHEFFNERGVMTSVTIFLVSTNTVIDLNPTRKTYTRTSFTQMEELSRRMSVEGNSTEQFVRQEEIEGKMCDYYRITVTTTQANGRTGTHVIEEWRYPAIGNHAIRKIDTTVDRDPRIERNIRIGPQPAHLFVPPNDYTDATARRDQEMQNLRDQASMFGLEGLF